VTLAWLVFSDAALSRVPNFPRPNSIQLLKALSMISIFFQFQNGYGTPHIQAVLQVRRPDAGEYNLSLMTRDVRQVHESYSSL
jgi:hypothetical protein